MWFRLYRREVETLRDAEAGLLEAPAPQDDQSASGIAPVR